MLQCSNRCEAVVFARPMSEVAAVENYPVVPGRECGRCTLCCKVPSIPEIGKPEDTSCRDCDVGHGCRIYADRPVTCREFFCGYLTQPGIGEHWYPARSKMVLIFEPDGQRLAIYVDSARPNAWREQPYYRDIKQWAVNAARDLRQVIVCVGNRSIVILPDEDVDLGHIAADERINVREVMENGRLRLRVSKMRADDPRLAGVRIREVATYRP